MRPTKDVIAEVAVLAACKAARANERARILALLDDAVDSLFVNGSGQRATRLVLFCDATQRDLGGWCKGAILDRLLAALDKADA